MQFRTALTIPASDHKISHENGILTIGSCFSQHIGEKLQKYKFKCISNPFGTVFNPISLAKLIQYSLTQQMISSGDLKQSQGVWVHPDFHSSFSHVDQQKLMENINSSIHGLYEYWKKINYVCITLGTSFAYQDKESGNIVSNCHKLPMYLFDKVEISVDQGVEILGKTFESIWTMNPDIHVILTVSPVRHIKDGIIQNTQSKAKLHLMVQELVASRQQVSYFPAYEWVMDDLRDYRYYEEDMIHPNSMAVEYIWQKFVDCYFDTSTTKLTQRLEEIYKAIAHRPFHPNSIDHITFKSHMLKKIQDLQHEFPILDLRNEFDYFV